MRVLKLLYGSVCGDRAAQSLTGLLYKTSQSVSELCQLKDLAVQQLQQCSQALPEILLLLLVLL